MRATPLTHSHPSSSLSLLSNACDMLALGSVSVFLIQRLTAFFSPFLLRLLLYSLEPPSALHRLTLMDSLLPSCPPCTLLLPLPLSIVSPVIFFPIPLSSHRLDPPHPILTPQLGIISFSFTDCLSSSIFPSRSLTSSSNKQLDHSAWE